ncbi:MAG: flagellar basal-body rod protein FlgF [Desulfobacterota bacterium]|nr:flagellar basal-body rod protein FlgF [Thermodesulfobacteriota bacterium]
MQSGIYIAVSGAKLQELRLDITANNLANVNTSGYKADKVVASPFETELGMLINESETLPAPLTGEPVSPYDIAYAQTMKVGTSFSQGNMQVTGNPLNAALEGPGFFAVDTPNGIRYTRQGNFALDQDGRLITSDGFPVRGKGLSGLSAGDITIDINGNVMIDNQPQGSLEIVEFDDPAKLKKEGHNLFVAPPDAAPRTKAGQTTVHQGTLEMSNVTIVTEMVTMIELNRMYQAYQKMITSIDECTGRLIESVASA